MNKTITCIVCPRGCAMTATIQGETITVTGNACARGEKHAIGECTNPVRSLTSTVRISNRVDTMVPVKSETPVPKGKLFEIMTMLRGVQLQAPVEAGQVVIEDAFGSRIITTGACK